MPPPSPSSPRRRGLLWATLIGVLLLGTGAGIGYVALQRVTDAEYLEQTLNDALAAATDSLYRVEIGAVDLSIRGRYVQLDDFRLRLDAEAQARLREQGTLPAVRYQIDLPRVRLDGLHLWALAWQRALKASTLRVSRPHLHAMTGDVVDDAPEDSLPTPTPAEPLHIRLARQLPLIMLDEVALDETTLTLRRGPRERVRRDTLANLSLRLLDLTVDSTSAHDPRRALFSDDVQIDLPGYRRISEDSLYVLDVGAVHGSSRDAVLDIAAMRFEPTLPDAEFLRRKRFRTSRFRTATAGLALSGLDYRRLIEEGAFIAEMVQVDSLWLDVFSDHRFARRPGKPPPTMPHEAFQRINVPVQIDSVRVSGGRVRYAQVAEDGARPGEIVFDEVEATIHNISNDTTRMTAETPATVQATARVAGAGRLNTTIQLPLLAPALDFSYQGQLGTMDATAFNAVFPDLAGIEVRSGQIESMQFDVRVRRGIATGTVDLRYHDLRIREIDKVTGRRGVRRRVRSFLANRFVVKTNNPPDDDKPPRIGTVEYAAEPGDSFFKVLWRSLRSGLFSVIR